MNLFSTLLTGGASLYVRIALYAAVAAALAGAYGLFVHHERNIGREEVHAEWNAAKVEQQKAAIAESTRNAIETQRRLAAQQKAQEQNAQDLARAQLDAAAATAAAGRLSRQLAAFTAAARGTAGHPAVVGDGTPAGNAIDLLADLFSRADSEAGILAEALDRSHAAGQQCERSYDALAVKP